MLGRPDSSAQGQQTAGALGHVASSSFSGLPRRAVGRRLGDGRTEARVAMPESAVPWPCPAAGRLYVQCMNHDAPKVPLVDGCDRAESHLVHGHTDMTLPRYCVCAWVHGPWTEVVADKPRAARRQARGK